MKLESLGRRRHFHPAVDQQRENTPTYGQYRQPWINNVKTHTDIRTIPTAVDQQRQRKSELVRIRPIKGRSIKASIKASVKESIKASISRQASNHRQACASFPTCASCHLRVLPPARLAHLYNLRALPADKLARSPSRGGQAVHSCVEQASVSGVQMVRVPRCVAEEAGAGRRTRGERPAPDPAPDEVTTPPSWPS